MIRVRRRDEGLGRAWREAHEGVVPRLDQRDLAAAQIHDVNGMGWIGGRPLYPHKVGADRVKQVGRCPGRSAHRLNAALESGGERRAGEQAEQQQQQPIFGFSKTGKVQRQQP